MKTLFEYVEEADKEYNFRVRFAVPVSTEMHSKMETVLSKFDVKKVGTLKKTIIQGRAFDFPELGPTEIFMADIVTSLPATREAIRQALSDGLRVAISKISVRTPDEPLETDREEKEESKKVLLDSDYEKTEPGTKYYGDKYNQDMVKNHKSEFKYEVAGGLPKADPGPVYDNGKSSSPLSSTSRAKP